ncbi:sugar phosphate isomerase/epimerase family protein [Candidatus Poribacteria bacterium]
MKYGINFLLWSGDFNKDSLPLIQKAADIGFDGVEIPIFDPDTVDIKATGDALKAAGMECTGCSILGDDRDLISDDPAVRENAKKYMKECIEIVSALGGSLFCGPLYSAVGKLVGRSRTEEEWDLAVSGLKEVAKVAGDSGVTLAIEPLNRFETYFINIAEDAAQLARDVDHPNVKVHLDTFHMNIEEKDIATAIRNTGDLIAHMHCCENDRGAPGSGHVDWDGVFQALDDVNYDAWIVIESFVPAIEAIAKAAAIWRQLDPGGANSVAVDGLKFLKSYG